MLIIINGMFAFDRDALFVWSVEKQEFVDSGHNYDEHYDYTSNAAGDWYSQIVCDMEGV